MNKYTSVKFMIYTMMLFLLVSTQTMVNATESNPSTMLKNVADNMLNNLKKNKANLQKNPVIVYDMARKIIVPHADLLEMSKRVIPSKVWNSATAAQKVKFQNEFTTTLIRTYSSALAAYDNQTIEFFPVRGGYNGHDIVDVSSQIIRPDGPPVNVTYSVLLKNGSWKLIDMTVEGVSMLESFRSQFEDQLNRGNMDNLLQVLAQHNTINNQSVN